MTTVISVPPSLDEQSFEQVIEQLAPLPEDEKILVDARHARWASPYGLTALLCVAQSREQQMGFAVPENPDTVSYWSRTGFFRYAAELYEMHGHVPRARDAHESDVLLEITPIVQSDDVHGVVGRIQQKAADILHGQLNLDTAVTGSFGMTLSESCQNIVEHAGLGGWVAVQTYKYTRRLGRRVVVIAVCDAGMGFRKSLESSPSHRHSDRWDDGMALEDAVFLADQVDTNRGDPVRAFQAYEDGRFARMARVQMTSRFFGDIYHAGGVMRDMRREIFSKLAPKDVYNTMSWLFSGI